MKKTLVSVMCLFAVVACWSQKINVDFPHFGGQEYVVYLLNGEKTDTVSRGVLDKQGKATLVIPAAHKNFTGIARWSLINGGGLALILNGEKSFTVRCPEAQPSDDNIFYIDTPENEFMYGQYLRQAEVISKAMAITQALQEYRPHDSLYAVLDLERQRLENRFEKIQLEIAQSPLYAARIRQYSDYLTYTGSRLPLTQSEVEQERRDFIEKKLNLEQLYHSGFWGDVLAAFVASTSENDSLLVAHSRLLLAQVAHREEIKEDLLHKFILQYNKYGKEHLLVYLGIDDLASAGRPAPMLRLTNKYIRPTNSLVIFYETGCNSCENELLQLRGNYPVLKEKGIEVISVAADLDEATFRKNADLFPWTDKYCDYQGFAGENFVNYQVKGTPTLFLTDKTGKIVGRYAKLAEVFDEL